MQMEKTHLHGPVDDLRGPRRLWHSPLQVSKSTSDKEAGVPLVEHEDVIGVSFTGSPATARDIATRAAAGLKRTSFELGGKSANIIFADADLSKAVPLASMGIFMNSGQVCVAGSRILVQQEIYDEFLEGFEKIAGAWQPGNPLDRNTRLGPLVSKSQYERVMSYLDLARDEGRILFGGGRPAGIDKGYFVEPTAIVEASPRHAFARRRFSARSPRSSLLPTEMKPWPLQTILLMGLRGISGLGRKIRLTTCATGFKQE